MNIEIKYQAEDGEIRYYHFESWELAEDDAFREAMQEFRSTRTGKNKILSIRDASIGAGRNHFRGITKMVAGTNTAS